MSKDTNTDTENSIPEFPPLVYGARMSYDNGYVLFEENVEDILEDDGECEYVGVYTLSEIRRVVRSKAKLVKIK